MARLEASVRRAADLSPDDIAAMHALHDRYYGGGDAATFREDMTAKSDVIVLTEDGELRGFSTLAVQRLDAPGDGGWAIFSGDTIIDHEYWGEQALARAFCRHAGRLSARHPGDPLYWFLISKGYRTYRYLHAFARRFYPHPHEATPPVVQRRMDWLASARFGACYRPDLGIVRFEPVRGFLRAPWSAVREGLRARADVAFFLERNPGYARGDELVCIAELSESNLRSVARREFVEGRDDERRAAAA